MRILVTGLGGMAGANVVKLLPSDSIAVACDANPAARQKLKQIGREDVKFYTVPHASNKDAFKMAINSIVIRQNIDVVIPTVDEELMVLSYRPEHIDARVVVSPYLTVRACNDKAMLYESIRDEPFCPRHVVTESKQDLAVFGQEPVFMKPRTGRGSKGIQLFRNYTEIPQDLVSKDNIFCENLPGQEYTVDCLFDFEGNPVLVVPRKRIQVIDGKSAVGETIRHPEIEERVKKLCSIFKFIGHVNIQFKEDSAGTMKLVEINPRFSGGLPITAEAGANSPELLCRMLSGESVIDPGWREGVFQNTMIQGQDTDVVPEGTERPGNEGSTVPERTEEERE